MFDIMEFDKNLPPSVRRQLQARLSLILQIGVTTKASLELLAKIYRDGWFTLVTDANQANLLKLAFQQNHDRNDIDAEYKKWLKNYKSDVNHIYRVIGDKLNSILEDMPTDAQPSGLFEEMGSELMLLLTSDGSNNSTEVDPITQLGMDSEHMIADMSQDQLANIHKIFDQIQLQNEESSDE